MKEIVYFKLENGKEPVDEWISSLDIRTQSRIYSRLERISQGNYGDVKKLTNSELSEIRLALGKGYRIYYAEVENIIILLINAGDKSTQISDIKKANKYFILWKEQSNE
ncbi:MAG: type II toxin-antitoxin system RelE/ParE family toxin [Heliobacteriaceae bacterium]|jgi:putative addiction module killer protein|nr:type II toxin-antitoxin system RelE/ParE family toxin [Heliobacteriaceae bacterium]